MRIPLNRGEGTGILVRPTPEHAEEIRAFRRELLESGSAADGTGGQYSYSPQVVNTADSHEISHWARTLVISICTAILSAWMMKQNRL